MPKKVQYILTEKAEKYLAEEAKRENQIPDEPVGESLPHAYYDLFKFFSDEHNLLLTDGEMSDIIHAVNEYAAKFKV